MNEWDDDMLDEGPQDCDLDAPGDDYESQTEPCPACGAEIYEDSPQCPICGEYVFVGAGATRSLPWWWVLAGFAALIAFIFYLLL